MVEEMHGARASGEHWQAFFSRFETIVLVANSEAVDIDALRQQFGEAPLFVFFNKVFKILDRPFDGESLLVARSSAAGANIVYRREVDEVLPLLRGARFHGILNLKAGPAEAFSPAAEFGGATVGHLDLVAHFAGFYPESHVPTSGFAMALWLAETVRSATVVLAGFTGRRGVQWKLFHDHDWTFEQIVQRTMAKAGRLRIAEGMPAAGIEVLAARFPGLSREDIALVASDVLSERLEGTNMAVDRLFSLTKLQGRLDGFFRRIKPKTRKQKLAETSGETTKG